MRNWTNEIRMDVTKDKERYLPCPLCSNDTRHKTLTSADYVGVATDMEFDWLERHEIVQCLGCEYLSFRKASTNSESYSHDEHGDIQPDIKEELFPSRIGGRRDLANTHYLPSEVKRIYQEAKLAVANPQPTLAGIGIRALVETVCKEKSASGGNLEQKIDSLAAAGLLTTEGSEILHGLRFLGNDAAHESTPHSKKTLNVALDVIENLLTNVYILPKVAEGQLKRRGSP
jgi:hypothetical protein